jgi:hypothetical protein
MRKITHRPWPARRDDGKKRTRLPSSRRRADEDSAEKGKLSALAEKEAADAVQSADDLEKKAKEACEQADKLAKLAAGEGKEGVAGESGWRCRGWRTKPIRSGRKRRKSGSDRKIRTGACSWNGRRGRGKMRRRRRREKKRMRR